MEYILCAVSIKNEIRYSIMGKIEGMYENSEYTKKSDKNDVSFENRGIMKTEVQRTWNSYSDNFVCVGSAVLYEKIL